MRKKPKSVKKRKRAVTRQRWYRAKKPWTSGEEARLELRTFIAEHPPLQDVSPNEALELQKRGEEAERYIHSFFLEED